MPADARITYRKRNPYNTRSNYYKKVRTPGSRIVIHYLKKLHLKQRSLPKCADTGKPLRGVLPNRGNYKNRRLTNWQIKRKAVSRAYGGNLSHSALRVRIMRAFLTEEGRIVRKVQKARREKRLQGKTRPKKKRILKKKKHQPKPRRKRLSLKHPQNQENQRNMRKKLLAEKFVEKREKTRRRKNKQQKKNRKKHLQKQNHNQMMNQVKKRAQKQKNQKRKKHQYQNQKEKGERKVKQKQPSQKQHRQLHQKMIVERRKRKDQERKVEIKNKLSPKRVFVQSFGCCFFFFSFLLSKKRQSNVDLYFTNYSAQ